MALSNVVKNQFDSGTIVIEDGTGTPLSVTVRFDQADFSISGLKQVNRGTTAYQSRATVHSIRHTAREFPTGSFSAMVSEFSESGTGTVLDMIHGTGGHSARVSTTASSGDVITFDITFTMEGTDFGDSADHTFTLEDCEIAYDFAEGDPNTLSFSFTCYGAVTGDIAIAA